MSTPPQETIQKISRFSFLAGLFLLTACTVQQTPSSDPLPSWNDGEAKSRILNFVKSVTSKSSADYLPAAQRVAAFDNDGTLWAEQPIYFQIYFALARVKEMAGEHPEWKDKQPFRAVLEDDQATLKTFGVSELLTLMAATHAGISQEEFEAAAKSFITTAKHPQRGVLFTDLVYQPMLELLKYLRQMKFKVFIVSGGGIDFIRAFSEEVYGIPKENVIGTTIQTKFQEAENESYLIRLPEIVQPLDDKEGKPVNLHRFIGRRPILAFGNSDGDMQMLQYSDDGSGPSLQLILHHDDAEREYAYDRKSTIGRLDRALDEAATRGWTVVSMKTDFKKVFAEKTGAGNTQLQ